MAYLHVMKKTAFLITHPKDPTTKFLERLYHYLPNKTVITGGVPKSELRKKIERGDPGDRLIFCGHGCGNGLFGAGQFPDADGLIIDESFVDSLRNKPIPFSYGATPPSLSADIHLTGFSPPCSFLSPRKRVTMISMMLTKKQLINLTTPSPPSSPGT